MRPPRLCLAATVVALGATLQPLPAAAAGSGAVLNVTVRVVDACSVTAPPAGPRPSPPRGVGRGIGHRCTGPVPPHRVTLRPTRERASAAAEHGPGRTALRRTREDDREVVIVTVTY